MNAMEDTSGRKDRRIPLVETGGLEVTYGTGREKVRAVRGVDLAIAPGEALGLVGESGCGKSSLGRALLRLEDPSSGEVLFEGSPVTGLRGAALKAFRRRAQIIFQDPFGSLNPRLKVGRAIEEVLHIHGLGADNPARRRRVRELLDDVGLEPAFADRYPHEFSGGQRQRICIARALALDPVFLVADEPVSALDVSVQANILDLLRRIRAERDIAMLFISHDLAVVRAVCERIAVMKDGEIVETGTADQVCDRPRHAYTKKLLSAVPDLAGIGEGA
ncbi:ATP-binding cassette domain-containing protein [Kiritimatiella glycovorans]|uniref:Peptide ABC transporter ATPase n=1 Tax=Kiritimatiella glycovorans TaxID=1307763 RepID=A0A0G3EIZ5_9BACT|nr:ATP-binding cassette domain-containing protein [Kiritimatiella glycovorans]AKJ65392.1 Peptide ABC transporter ATPase [Kiritimatiella glycovorans]